MARLGILGIWNAYPVEAAGKLGGGGRPGSSADPRLGYRRLDSSTCFTLRGRRNEAHLRDGIEVRLGCVRFFLDQIGPFSQTVEDAALLLETISGHDPLDSTSYPAEVPSYSQILKEDPQPCALGLPKEFFGEGMDDEVRTAVDKAIEFYKGKGYEIFDVSLPTTDLSIPVYYVIATAEASSNLARYDGIRYTKRSDRAENAVDVYAKSRGEGFGEEVKRRCILGAYGLSSGYYDAYYLRAQKTRTLIRRDFERVFEKVDAILTPTSPTPAFKFGEKSEDPISMYLSGVYPFRQTWRDCPAYRFLAGSHNPACRSDYNSLEKRSTKVNCSA